MGHQVHFSPRVITVSIVMRPEIGVGKFCSQEVKNLSDNLRITEVTPGS